MIQSFNLYRFLNKIRIVSQNPVRLVHYDVVIAGGGVMGSSSAYFLKSKEPQLNIAVIERDFTVSHALI